MRERLYRGKRTDNGEWVEVECYNHYKGNGIWEDSPQNEIYFVGGYACVKETICEFTGLTDKNGNKIFEGDILSFTVFYYNNNDIQYKGVVKWSDTEKLATRFMIWHDNENEYYGNDGAFDFDWVHYQDSEIEIIGNIYDNPELLEK